MTAEAVVAIERHIAAAEQLLEVSSAGSDGKSPTLPQDATVGKASRGPDAGMGTRQRGKGAGRKGKGG